MNLFPVRSISGISVLTITLALLVALGAGCGGSDSVAPPVADDQTDTQSLDHDGYDGVTPLRARADGLVLSVKPAVIHEDTDFGDRWRLAFEANQPLTSALSWGQGGELGQARMQDDYRFEVRLDAAEVHHLLTGAKLYLMLTPADGERRVYNGMVRLAPRFVDPDGSLLIWLDPAFEQVQHHGASWLRGFATTAARITGMRVEAASGAAPSTVASEGVDRWRIEWDLSSMRTALHLTDEPVIIIGSDQTGGEHRVSAKLHLVVEELGLTTGDAEQTWPAIH